MNVVTASVMALLLTTNIAIASPRTSAFEIVAESDGTNQLTGFHFIQTFKGSHSKLSGYFGAGPVYVKLPEADDEFPAIHALAGTDIHLTKFFSLSGEIGFDLIENILLDDRGNQQTYDEESNKVDISFALGVKFDLEKKLYVKAYYRHHIFDGVFLPETKVDFTGVRVGFYF